MGGGLVRGIEDEGTWLEDLEIMLTGMREDSIEEGTYQQVKEGLAKVEGTWEETRACIWLDTWAIGNMGGIKRNKWRTRNRRGDNIRRGWSSKRSRVIRSGQFRRDELRRLRSRIGRLKERITMYKLFLKMTTFVAIVMWAIAQKHEGEERRGTRRHEETSNLSWTWTNVHDDIDFLRMTIDQQHNSEKRISLVVHRYWILTQQGEFEFKNLPMFAFHNAILLACIREGNHVDYTKLRKIGTKKHKITSTIWF